MAVFCWNLLQTCCLSHLVVTMWLESLSGDCRVLLGWGLGLLIATPACIWCMLLPLAIPANPPCDFSAPVSLPPSLLCSRPSTLKVP
jgi:hypothetical protein